MEQEWEDLTDGLIQALEAEGITEAEALVVVGIDTQTRELTTRSFARSDGERNPSAGESSEHLGDLKVFGAKLEINSPRRCYYNGYYWVCYA